MVKWCLHCEDYDEDGYDACDSDNPDDNDGQPADFDDTDLKVNPGASETGETACTDTKDNDCDGATDC
jgi:hypothetical protein